MIEPLFAENQERRDRVQIFADIIKVTTGPTKTTRILRLANVQYNTFKECIEIMCEAGLLRKVNPNDAQARANSNDQRVKYVYAATNTGLKWCEMVNEVYQKLSVK